ncbi:MAG: FG-GAP-like repeat-containing protein [Myxococcota bacterium]|nr:FG-GAP-like repeat-containing protein [Myxococcota bacterium]
MARLDRHILCTLAACALAAACTEDAPSADAGVIAPDATAADAGTADAGIVDSGAPVDAGAPPERELAWTLDLPNTSYGSPRLFESEDGPELLLTFGAVFGNRDPGAVIGGAMSVNAISGEVEWQIDRDAELFTVAVPVQPRGDQDNLYLFGGKRGVLMAVDVERGEMRFQAEPYYDASREAGVWNYYTGMEVRDINADGIGEFLVTNGGDDYADIGDPRPPGWLEVLSGADLSVIHRLPVPEAAETYSSPTLWTRQGVPYVVYGTGGETLPGSLFEVPLESVLAGNLEGQRELVAPVADYGCIAPPAYADLDGDGALEMVVVPYDGRVVAFSGATGEVLWEHAAPTRQETAASPIIGDFDGDGDLDVVATRVHGIFPVWTGSDITVYDGRTGAKVYENIDDSEVLVGTSLAVDLDGDQVDEVLFARSSVPTNPMDPNWSTLSILHVDEERVEVLGEQEGLIGSAGWVGDADGDGYLEWYATTNSISVSRLVRYNLGGRVPQRIAWGGYLGTRHDGRY